MNNENRAKYYPPDVTEEEAAKLFKTVWTEDYHRRLGWNEEKRLESISGYGSSILFTKHTVNALPQIFSKYNIKSILDVPCGDFHWMKTVDLSGISYIGLDLVEAQVERNRSLYPSFDFRVMDMVRDELPQADLIFSRDSLIHLNDDDIISFLKNCKKSGAKYFMTSTYSDLAENKEMGGIHGWRFINFQIEPWSFPTPLEFIDEKNQSNPSKGMALWLLSDLYG